MSGHTPEPWVKIADNDIFTEGGDLVCGFYRSDFNGIQNALDARRIVACVNACKGIPLEVLEAPGYSVKAELDTLDRQIELRIESEKRVNELEEQITLLTR